MTTSLPSLQFPVGNVGGISFKNSKLFMKIGIFGKENIIVTFHSLFHKMC